MIHRLKLFKKTSMPGNFSLCFLSACLLILAFPRVDISILAWIGLCPLLIALDGQPLKKAWWLGYFTGLIFFSGTCYWLLHVTFIGLIFLVLYLAVYFGLFALIAVRLEKRSVVEKLLFLPAGWVVLEFIRAHFITGFGWVSLGYSQYRNLGLIQIADITGMYGVSYLIVMVNVLFKEVLSALGKRVLGIKTKELVVGLIVVVCLFVASRFYGLVRLKRIESPPKIKVAVIQPSIAQRIKWNPSYYRLIMKQQFSLTQKAAEEKPDLIIWPETSFPAYAWEEPQLFEALKDFVSEMGIPVLFGMVLYEDEKYYNAAVLLSSQKDIIERYDKMHLVLFGEYIPLRNVFPFLSGIVPIGDFSAGDEYTLFPASTPIGDPDRVPKDFFSALICFEDTVPYLSREFVKKGANLLVNITNDAWFLDTNEPFLHQQAAVFRTVENRRSLVRASNTGVSCFINRQGCVTNAVTGFGGKQTYVSGYAVEDVFLNEEKTFYTKFGDVFTYLCFGGILWMVIRRK